MKILFKLMVIMVLNMGVAQADEALTRQTHQKFIDDYIVPHLNKFKTQASQFDKMAAAVCATTDAQNIDQVKTQYALMVRAWMPLISMRFDVFEKNSRDLRIYFWPNSRGEKQALKMLPKMDDSKLAADYFHNLSVALQGLPIVEWLFYHPDSHLFEDSDLGHYSCRYLQAISLNLLTVNDELIAEFSQGGRERELLLNPSDDNELYRDLHDVTLQFYKAVHAMTELVHGPKLSRPIGRELKFLKPKRLEMWRSGQTKQNMLANIANIEDAYKIFSPMVIWGDNGKQVDAEIKALFTETLVQMNALPDDLYAALNGETKQQVWQQARDLIAQLALLKDTLGVKGTTALGIPLGFNSLDGD